MHTERFISFAYRGEPRSTTILRAFWAAIIILAVSIFSTYNIIIEPMRETASPPVKDIRSFSIPQDALNDILQALVWNVLFVSDKDAFIDLILTMLDGTHSANPGF
jgi:hypothetical protein